MVSYSGDTSLNIGPANEDCDDAEIKSAEGIKAGPVIRLEDPAIIIQRELGLKEDGMIGPISSANIEREWGDVTDPAVLAQLPEHIQDAIGEITEKIGPGMFKQHAPLETECTIEGGGITGLSPADLGLPSDMGPANPDYNEGGQRPDPYDVVIPHAKPEVTTGPDDGLRGESAPPVEVQPEVTAGPDDGLRGGQAPSIAALKPDISAGPDDGLRGGDVPHVEVQPEVTAGPDDGLRGGQAPSIAALKLDMSTGPDDVGGMCYPPKDGGALGLEGDTAGDLDLGDGLVELGPHIYDPNAEVEVETGPYMHGENRTVPETHLLNDEGPAHLLAAFSGPDAEFSGRDTSLISDMSQDAGFDFGGAIMALVEAIGIQVDSPVSKMENNTSFTV